MAKINTDSLGSEGHASAALISLLGSLGVMLCLIVSLLGIKIWWFKHRLTFDQSSSRNGAAGGAQPAVVTPRVSRSRSSKDKRLSQQVCESVVVHGVFRKRQEDDLEYTQPNRLPPVRIRQLSQSTPSLLILPMPTPKHKHIDDSSMTIPMPPTRDPPRPPRAKEATLLAENGAVHFQNIEHNTAPPIRDRQQQPLLEAESVSTPLAPKQDSGRKFVKAKAALEPIYRPTNAERRLTGFFKYSDENLQDIQPQEINGRQTVQIEEELELAEQFGERRPTGYIKYEEVDMAEGGLADFHDKWDNLQLGKNVPSADKEYQNIKSGYSNYEHDGEKHFNWNEESSVKERRPTGYPVKEEEQLWNNNNTDGRLHQYDQLYEPDQFGLKEFPEFKKVEYTKQQDGHTWNSSDFDNSERSVSPNAENSVTEEFDFKETKERSLLGYPVRQDVDNKEKIFFEDVPNSIIESVNNLNLQDAHLWNNNDYDNNKSSLSRQVAQSSSLQNILEIERDYKNTEVPETKHFTDDIDIFERTANMNFETKEQTNEEKNDPSMITRSVKFIIPNDNDRHDDDKDHDEEKNSTWQVHRRPTGYARNEQSIWADLEDSVAGPAEAVVVNDKSLWLEMEKDIESDFSSNIEHEFNKIRQGYEENEGDFLEAKKEKQLAEDITTKDMGFGKSIDEDWESFERLEESVNDFRKIEINHRTEKSISQDRDYVHQKSQKHEKNDFVEQKTRTDERHTVGVYESHHTTELYENSQDHERFSKKVVTFEEEEVVVGETAVSIIQARRPTGFITRDLDKFRDELVETNTSKRRVKPRQKVTFDFNTEEYYLPADEEEDDDSELEPENYSTNNNSFIEIPKPMQRMTKMQYTEEANEKASNDIIIKVTQPTTPPILFSTQISREDSPEITAQDSWSAIRQHRYLTEEFQHISLDANAMLKPAPRQKATTSKMRAEVEAPKPAFRNPLAQIAVDNSISQAQIASDNFFEKPRTMREMKKEPSTASRQTGEQYNFTDYSTSSTTEA